jgi:ParB-like nuclease domain
MAAAKNLATVPIRALALNYAARGRADNTFDPELVADYRERMEAGDVFPPLDVVSDGESYWLVEGWYRYEAQLKLGRKNVQCRVQKGDLRDAILASVSANATNGARRTIADKIRRQKALERSGVEQMVGS